MCIYIFYPKEGMRRENNSTTINETSRNQVERW